MHSRDISSCERHRSIADGTDLMPLPCACNARLAGSEHGCLAIDRELRLAVQHQKHFVTEIMRMTGADLVRIKAHDARANLRRDE